MKALPRLTATPQEEAIYNEFTSLLADFFAEKKVSQRFALAMLSSMVTFTAIRNGFSAEDYGKLMAEMHTAMQSELKRGTRG